jgi:hypothetical protein
MRPPLKNRGYLYGSGTVVPTDGTDGWQTGAVFHKTDGGNNTSLYVNEGSVTSCTFNALTTGGPADVLEIGAFASLLKGSGIPISSTQRSAIVAYGDDNGLAIASSVYNTRSRMLLTVDQAGASIRAFMGQLKLADGVDVQTGIYSANQGYVELAGDTSAKTGATFSCFDASLEIASAKTLTVDSGGEACGIHVETTGAGTITNNGTCAAVLIDKASGSANWPYGVYVVGSTCNQAFVAGVQGTGVETTTTYPFAVEIHNEANADVVAGNTGSSAGIYNRYEIAVAQTSQCNHISVFAKLRPKANMADGVHCGVYGLVEASETIDISGTATTMTCAGHFALDLGSGVTVSAGHLNGVVIDSSINASATTSGTTIAGLRFKKSGTSKAWVTGIALESSATTTGIAIGTCTTGITIGSCTDGIVFNGTVTSGKCIDFADVTMAAGSSNNLWSYGDGVAAVEVTITDYWFPARMNVASIANPGSELLASLFWLTFAVTTAHQANLDVQGVGCTVNLEKNVGYAHGIESLVDVKASLSCSTGTCIGAKFGLDLSAGTTLTIGVGSPASSVCAVSSGTGTTSGGVVSIIEARKQDASTIANGVWVNVLTGATVTTAFEQSGAGTVTNLFGCRTTNGPAVATRSGSNSTGSIKITVQGATKYLQYWDAAS